MVANTGRRTHRSARITTAPLRRLPCVGEAIDIADDDFLARLQPGDDFDVVAFHVPVVTSRGTHRAIFENEHACDSRVAQHRGARDEERAVVARFIVTCAK